METLQYQWMIKRIELGQSISIFYYDNSGLTKDTNFLRHIQNACSVLAVFLLLFRALVGKASTLFCNQLICIEKFINLFIYIDTILFKFQCDRKT
ncbi:hypothetical protein ACJX0J_037864, partial [Zea mays]